MDRVVRGPLRECVTSGLLTDDDFRLVDEELNGNSRLPSLIRLVGPFVAVAACVYAFAYVCETNGFQSTSSALKFLLNVYLVFGIYGLHLLWLPFVVRFGTWQFHRVDYRFHEFISNLRQKDSLLYGLKRMAGDEAGTHARRARVQCVEQLRRLIRVAQAFGDAFSIDVPSIADFLSDELRELSRENADIVDAHLKLNALTALWQFYYIQRSETLRNFAICHADVTQRALSVGSWWSFLKFARASLLEFIKFAWFSTRFDVRLESAANRRAASRTFKTQRVSEVESISIRLEYALEKLHQTELRSPEARRLLSDLLLDIVSQLQPPRKQPKTQRPRQVDSEPVDRDPEFKAEVEEEGEVEYQVFEAAEDENSAESSGEDPTDDPFAPPPIPRRDLQAELRNALASRRERDVELQVQALAKSRRCPVEEVREELNSELERTKRQPTDKPVVVETKFAKANSSVRVGKDELTAALRQRFINVKPVETFGDSSTEDEN